MPGDYDIEYASPWAGANYMPCVEDKFDVKIADFAYFKVYPSVARRRPNGIRIHGDRSKT
jgi:D-amino-acid oxidase